MLKNPLKLSKLLLAGSMICSQTLLLTQSAVAVDVYTAHQAYLESWHNHFMTPLNVATQLHNGDSVIISKDNQILTLRGLNALPLINLNGHSGTTIYLENYCNIAAIQNNITGNSSGANNNAQFRLLVQGKEAHLGGDGKMNYDRDYEPFIFAAPIKDLLFAKNHELIITGNNKTIDFDISSKVYGGGKITSLGSNITFNGLLGFYTDNNGNRIDAPLYALEVTGDVTVTDSANFEYGQVELNQQNSLFTVNANKSYHDTDIKGKILPLNDYEGNLKIIGGQHKTIIHGSIGEHDIQFGHQRLRNVEVNAALGKVEFKDPDIYTRKFTLKSGNETSVAELGGDAYIKFNNNAMRLEAFTRQAAHGEVKFYSGSHIGNVGTQAERLGEVQFVRDHAGANNNIYLHGNIYTDKGESNGVVLTPIQNNVSINAQNEFKLVNSTVDLRNQNITIETNRLYGGNVNITVSAAVPHMLDVNKANIDAGTQFILNIEGGNAGDSINVANIIGANNPNAVQIQANGWQYNQAAGTLTKQGQPQAQAAQPQPQAAQPQAQAAQPQAQAAQPQAQAAQPQAQAAQPQAQAAQSQAQAAAQQAVIREIEESAPLMAGIANNKILENASLLTVNETKANKTAITKTIQTTEATLKEAVAQISIDVDKSVSLIAEMVKDPNNKLITSELVASAAKSAVDSDTIQKISSKEQKTLYYLMLISDLGENGNKEKFLKNLTEKPGQKTSASAEVGTMSQALMGQRMDVLGAAPASGDEEEGNSSVQKGVWVQGVLGNGSQKAGKNSAGYKSALSGGVIGADISIGKNIFGIAYSNIAACLKYNGIGAGDQTDSKNSILSFYGNQAINNLNFRGIASFIQSSIDIKDTKTEVGKVATAKLKGKGYVLDGALGYDVKLDQGVVITPFVGLNYSNYKTGAYTEKGSGIADRYIGSRTDSALTIKPGARLALSKRINNDTVITPNIYASVDKQLSAKTQNPVIKLVHIDKVLQVSNNSKKGKNLGLGYNLGAGVDIKYKNSEIELYYNCLVRQKYVANQAALKVKLLF